MRSFTLLCCAVLSVLMFALPTVSGVTNAEFYDLIKDYITDVEVIDDDELDFIGNELDDEADDVISLPGGPDDELDVEYLVDKLGLTKPKKASENVGWLHHHHHHHHHQPSFSCHCHHDSCSCCLTHTFKVNLVFKKLKFKLHACLTVGYIPRNYGFEITFTINGHRLFHKELSLKHPPSLCFGVPGLRGFARICLEFYSVNLRTKHVCARIAGVLDLKFKKFRVHLKLGCFKIPILDEQALTSLLNDRDFLHVDVQSSEDTDEIVELQDLVEAYRE